MKHRLWITGAALLIAAITTTGQNPAPAPTPTLQASQPPAPKATIEGTITRSGTGQPLKGVQVAVRRTDATAQAGRGGRGGTALGGAAGLGALGDLITAFTGAGRGNASVATDASGHFLVSGLDAGQYQISADREGMIHQEYGRRTSGSGRGTSVAVSAGQHLVADFQMDPAGVITGRVRDNGGEPVFRATVQAYTYRYNNGNRTLAQVATVQTDDLGQYRLFPITPGDYFISVTTRPETTTQSQADASATPTLGTAGGGQAQLLSVLGQLGGGLTSGLLQGLTTPGGPAPFYFPGTIDPDQASAIHVAASAEVRGIDLNLRPSPTVVVRGRVSAPFSLAANPPAARGGQQSAPQRGGQAGQAANLLSLLGTVAGSNAQLSFVRIGSARAGLGALLGGMNPTRVNADGSFEIPNVAPGSYYLSASASDNGQRYTGRLRVDVAGADVSNVIVEVRPGIEVHGKITVDSPPPQFKMSQLRVNLVETENPTGNIASQIGNLLQTFNSAGARGGNAGRGSTTTAMPQVADDGTFTLTNVAASVEYRVTISNASGGYLLDGRAGSSDALGAPFTVEAGTNLSLRIAFAAGKVTGTVVDSGKTFAGAQVVLVPDAPRRGRNDLYFSATSDATGTYNFNSVPAGTYRLFAWEEVASGAYQYPDFLRQYEPLGTIVRVEQGGTSGSELKLIPATTGN